MPKLGVTTTTKLELPSSKPDDLAYVEVKSELLMGDIADIQQADNNVDRTFTGLAKFISDWNFTEDGTPNTPKLVISADTIRQLKQQDFDFLAEKYNQIINKAESGLTPDEKKSSSPTSIEVRTEETPTVPVSPTII